MGINMGTEELKAAVKAIRPAGVWGLHIIFSDDPVSFYQPLGTVPSRTVSVLKSQQVLHLSQAG